MNSKPPTSSDNLYRRLYVLSAIAALVIVFAGFARTYFLKGIYFPAVTTRPIVHIHGLLMTLWFSLFLVQSVLIRKGNIALHRRMGIFGAILAATIIVVGPITAITAFKLSGAPPQFMSVALVEIVVFAIFVSLGLLLRKRKDFHKRFILLATLATLTSAMARIPLDVIQKVGLPLAFGLVDLMIVIVIVFDTVKTRRLHPAYGWGLSLIIGLQVLRLSILTDPTWIRFANWLVH